MTMMVVQIGKEKKNLATIEAQKSLNIINIILVASRCNLIKNKDKLITTCHKQSRDMRENYNPLSLE